jgi:ABC-2 type transport system permease protein
MIRKEFRQLTRDRRTLGLLVFVPVLLLVVFGYAARFDIGEVPTIVAGPDAEQVAGRLPDLFDVTDARPADGRDAAEDVLRRGDAVVAIVTGDAPVALLDGAELFSAQTAVGALQRIPIAVEVDVLFNPDLATSVVMVPAIVGLILVFVGTIATSLGVVREREAGTLEQLAVMPLTARDVFVGKIAPYLLIASLDMAVVVVAGMVLFGVPFEGSVLVFLAAAVLFLFVALGVGILISTVSRTQGEAIQLAMMTLLPQVLLSGFVFPLESMGVAVRWIAYVLPLTYWVDIARGVMVRGAPLGAVADSLALLALLAAVVAGAAVVRFRRELSPADQPDIDVRERERVRA